MASVRLSLSTVSAEFLSYRERLRHLLTRPYVDVKVQKDFIATGDEILEMLDTYVQCCDAVIHLVGDITGAMAKPQSVAAIAARYPDLARQLPLADFLRPEGPCLSNTPGRPGWPFGMAKSCSSPPHSSTLLGMNATAAIPPSRPCNRPTWIVCAPPLPTPASSSAARTTT